MATDKQGRHLGQDFVAEEREAKPVEVKPNRHLALAHPVRREILAEMKIPPAKPMSATDLSHRRAISRLVTADGRDSVSVISYHLRSLERTGLVEFDHAEQKRGAVKVLFRLTELADPLHGPLKEIAAVLTSDAKPYAALEQIAEIIEAVE